MNNFFDQIKEDDIYKFLSNGKWIKSKTGELIDINSPIDGKLIGQIQAVSCEEIDDVIEGAAGAQKRWATIAVEDRAAILKKAGELIHEHLEELTQAMVLEIAKTYEKAKNDICRGADIVSYTAEQLDLVNGGEHLSAKDFPGGSERKTTTVIRQPRGVILVITPFNYPINLATTKLAPALLVGNSVVVKGPTQGSICTAMLVEIFNRAGLPPGVINFVSGRGREIGDYLVAHKGIDMINFTGSSEVGKSLTQKAGLKPLLLELGGKDAALVLEDADLDLAAEQIVGGAFSYAGQRCTAIKRVLVHKNIHSELVKKIVEITKEKYSILGDPRKEETQLNPLISKRQAEYVEELLDDAVRSGAKILTGGGIEENYIEATVLDDVDSSMRIAWEEQFAPILPIITCEDEEEMIEIHNKSEYGLGGSVFSQNLEKAREIARRLETGVVQINHKSERFPDSFPFLGIKDSGLGVQGIKWSIEAMSRIKSIVDNV